jgi:glucan endo-1,3-alpha-glucosidase
MVGIVSTYAQADWENDMKIAKAHGVDGFALNIGKDDYSQKQLDLAYAAAEVVDFDLFISFDFNWYHIDEVDAVATMFKRYMDRPKQYKVDGKPFVSTFVGDGFDWGAVEKAVGKPIHSVPFYEPTAQNADLPSVSGLFSWYVLLLVVGVC